MVCFDAWASTLYPGRNERRREGRKEVRREGRKEARKEGLLIMFHQFSSIFISFKFFRHIQDDSYDIP